MCGVFLSADRLAVFTPSFIRFNECNLFFSPLLLHTLRETHMSLPSREALWSGMERVKECNLTQMETASRLHSEALNRFKPLQVTLIMTYDLKSEESWRKGGVGRPTKGKEESKWGTCGSLACTSASAFHISTLTLRPKEPPRRPQVKTTEYTCEIKSSYWQPRSAIDSGDHRGLWDVMGPVWKGDLDSPHKHYGVNNVGASRSPRQVYGPRGVTNLLLHAPLKAGIERDITPRAENNVERFQWNSI